MRRSWEYLVNTLKNPATLTSAMRPITKSLDIPVNMPAVAVSLIIRILVPRRRTLLQQ